MKKKKAFHPADQLRRRRLLHTILGIGTLGIIDPKLLGHTLTAPVSPFPMTDEMCTRTTVTVTSEKTYSEPSGSSTGTGTLTPPNTTDFNYTDSHSFVYSETFIVSAGNPPSQFTHTEEFTVTVTGSYSQHQVGTDVTTTVTWPSTTHRKKFSWTISYWINCDEDEEHHKVGAGRHPKVVPRIVQSCGSMEHRDASVAEAATRRGPARRLGLGF